MILKCRITRSCGHRFNYLFFEADEHSFIHRMRSTECDDCAKKGFNEVNFGLLSEPSQMPSYTFHGASVNFTSTDIGDDLLRACGFDPAEPEPDELPDDFDADNLDLGELIDG